MKRLLCGVALLLAFVFAACAPAVPTESPTPTAGTQTAAAEAPTPEISPAPDDITEKTDYTTEQWIAVEIRFASDTKPKVKKAIDVMLEATFTNRSTGTTLVIPGFYYEDKTFCVRFAPTECGIWDFVTSCEQDASLAGITGTVAANAYKGDLALYKHGFVTTNGTKHFVYADGTPFFYLGDTHWSLLTEEFDKAGDHADGILTDSHFKYIVDKRVSQGFTVYQSEPIGASFVLYDGSFDSQDVKGFKEADKYFQYIAEKGLVHANAQLFFTGYMTDALAADTEYLAKITRYWVARFGAYPVLWTMSQEVDYSERKPSPWVEMAKVVHQCDAYQHPLSEHQRADTNVMGLSGARSDFYDKTVTEETGHSWWAAQFHPSLIYDFNYTRTRDYWMSDKVAINYEMRYCCLWTKNDGARVQAWMSMLSGFAGVGYGAIDIWYYKSTYDTDTTSDDGWEQITPEDKALHWSESVEFESAYQQKYMKDFFESFAWWELVPDFDTKNHFRSASTQPSYVCATIENDLYVVLLYAKNTLSGTVCGMDTQSTYDAAWFDPRRNEYIGIGEVQTESGTWKAPEKPDTADYILILKKK